MTRYPIGTRTYLGLEARKLLVTRPLVLFSHCGDGCGAIIAEMGNVPDRRKLFDTYKRGPHSGETVFIGAVEDELVVWDEREGVKHEVA